MFVVVFLVEPKQHIIVPENHIFGLNLESLKNIGKNGNFRYKIFWSEWAVDADGVPDIEYIPDFDLPKRTTFPPAESGCYVGKLKKNFSK